MGDNELVAETDMEILASMWPEDIENKGRKQFNIEKPGMDRDLMEDVDIKEEPSVVDFKRLIELTAYSENGSSQLTYLLKHWEYKQANAARLLNEELANLNKQRQEVELKKLEILQGQWFEDEDLAGAKRTISILNDVRDIWGKAPRKSNNVYDYHAELDISAEYDTVTYWKQRAVQLDKLLEDSIHREQMLLQKLQENVRNFETQSQPPVEELSEILKRADNFLHFILQTAPVVMGHQDKELRYRFIYNHFPSLAEEDIIGKTDTEIFTGDGVDEIENFKREVLERGSPAKREITFVTPLFGAKTFLIYVEPVYSKQGEKIGLNYMGMDVTDQVSKREKMMKIREELAVQKAKETELNKTIHITEETMRAKQMLATMSHEIRSPLTGVVSMAEILATTRMDKEQRQLLDVMLSSGDLVLQLINDILDLSKVESGVMKLEATKFRPIEVVRHVLQTAAASLKKELTLKGNVAVDVPIEVVGDVLRIRQILTNLISNAIKFTHDGEVGINLRVVSRNCSGNKEDYQLNSGDFPRVNGSSSEGSTVSQSQNDTDSSRHSASCDPRQINGAMTNASIADECTKKSHGHHEVVWLRCDVHDTGIGIPEKALPSLFKKYMQASTDHARKYGGTGLGLAICKQLVELMGGNLTVTSKEQHGSTFSFVLPCKVPQKPETSDDTDEDTKISDAEDEADNCNNEAAGTFLFKPLKPVGLQSSAESMEFDNGNTISVSARTATTIAPDFGTLHSDSFARNDCPSKKIRTTNTISEISAVENVSKEDDNSLVKNGAPNGCDIGFSRTENNDNQDSMHSFVMHKFSSSTDPCRAQSITRQEKKKMICTEGSNTNASNNEPECQNSRHDKDNDSQSKLNSKTPRILLAEDNKVNIMVAQSMMKQLGHKIEVVNNGLEAVRAVQKSHYDLILMDVCMPVMDGLQATRMIRSFEEHGYWDPSVSIDNSSSSDSSYHSDTTCCRKRISIIAMTANALAESATDCLANGMDSFVSKPVTFQSLKRCLQQYLSI